MITDDARNASDASTRRARCFEQPWQVLSDGSVQAAVLAPHSGTLAPIHVIELHRDFYDHAIEGQQDIKRLVGIAGGMVGNVESSSVVECQGIHLCAPFAGLTYRYLIEVGKGNSNNR